MSLKQIKIQISEELGIPYEVVNRAYNSFWLFIRETIKELPLKERLSEEEFAKLRTNFNIPSLGKLSCTYDRYKSIKDKYEEIKNKYEESKSKED